MICVISYETYIWLRMHDTSPTEKALQGPVIFSTKPKNQYSQCNLPPTRVYCSYCSLCNLKTSEHHPLICMEYTHSASSAPRSTHQSSELINPGRTIARTTLSRGNPISTNEVTSFSASPAISASVAIFPAIGFIFDAGACAYACAQCFAVAVKDARSAR
jgi:hypothetical protein